MSEEVERFYLVAEYCGGPFYMGWWMYEREQNNGGPNRKGYSSWGWIRGDLALQAVRDLCVSMGHAPPPVERHRDFFAEWFARTFPNGLRVEKDDWGRYQLIEIPTHRPRQRRGTIRTIRGAALCDRTR
jgi:hypothetical protein